MRCKAPAVAPGSVRFPMMQFARRSFCAAERVRSVGCWRRDRWHDETRARLRGAARAFHAGASVFRPAPVNGLRLSCERAAGVPRHGRRRARCYSDSNRALPPARRAAAGKRRGACPEPECARGGGRHEAARRPVRQLQPLVIPHRYIRLVSATRPSGGWATWDIVSFESLPRSRGAQ